MNQSLGKLSPSETNTSRGYPEHIQTNPLRQFYGPIWAKAHNIKNSYSIVVCGDTGSGKSWLARSIADVLDCSRTSGTSRFSVERIAFTALDFLDIVSKDWPIGSVILFDDAGLGAFNRDAMMPDVKDIAKVFMSIRSKRWIIILTLPAFGMLDKVVRQSMKCYLEPVRIDYHTNMTNTKVREIWCNKYTGDVYFKYLKVKQKIIHPYGIPTTITKAIDTMWFPAPDKRLAEEMDIKKDVSLAAWRKRAAQRAANKEAVQDNKKTAKNILDEIVSAPEKLYGVNSRGVRAILPEKIMGVFDCSDQLAIKLAGMANRTLSELYSLRGLKNNIVAKNPKS